MSYEQQYYQSFTGLRRLSKKTGIKPAQIGVMIVEEKRPEIERYIRKFGRIPAKNPVELSIQATLTHENNVAKIMRTKGLSYNDAQREVFEMESALNFTGAENFAPALLGVVASVGRAGIEGINKKRIQNGKKPILSGKFWQSLKAKTSGVDLTTDGDNLNISIAGRKRTGEQTELGAGLSGAQAEIERQAKRDYLKKNLPIIILALVGVGIAVFFLVKKK
jgi:hypothetical protein